MTNGLQFYIDGTWVDPVEPRTLPVIDPSSEEDYAAIALGSFANVDKAVRIANDTVHGLAAYVQSADIDRARRVAARMRAGNVYIN